MKDEGLARAGASGTPPGNPRPSTEEKFERLLAAAAGLMACRGFNQTTMRDVARETGFSLAGMYYYFKSKEELLYKIQQRTFAGLLEMQEGDAEAGASAEHRLRRLIANHLAFFISHSAELKICTFELESLTGEPYEKIEELRKRYFRLTASIIGELKGVEGEASTDPVVRHHTLFVFGMLNWIFMWYQPERDGPAEELAGEMTAFVLHGLRGGAL